MRNSDSDFGFALGDQPALDELSRTDLLLDALAEREDVGFGDPDDLHDQALAALLGEWRDDLRWPPASALVSPEEAVEALRAGVTERGRTRRGWAAIGSVAATLLVLSGFGAVVADARPGDLLYGLHAMMFDDSRVSDDEIVLSAKAELARVEQMIAEGQWAQAQTQLAEVSSSVQAVNDGNRRQGLIDEVNELNTKVEKRDPNATLPRSAPSSTPGSTPQSELSPVLAPTDSPGNSPPAAAIESPVPPSPVVSAVPGSPVSPPPEVAASPSENAPAPAPSEAPLPSAQTSTPPMPSAANPAGTPAAPPAAAPSREPQPEPTPAAGSMLEPAPQSAPDPAHASTGLPNPDAQTSGQQPRQTPPTTGDAPSTPQWPGLFRLPRLGPQ